MRWSSAQLARFSFRDQEDILEGAWIRATNSLHDMFPGMLFSVVFGQQLYKKVLRIGCGMPFLDCLGSLIC